MKILLYLFAMVMLVSSARAQQASSGNPDFTGVWVLDETSIGKDSRKSIGDYVLTIDHSGDKIEMKRRYLQDGNANNFSETLYTDKRKEENLDLSGVTFDEGFGKVTITSKSYWKKGSVIREFIYERNARVAYRIDRQVISLSNDGQTLTIVTEFQPAISPTPVVARGQIALPDSTARVTGSPIGNDGRGVSNVPGPRSASFSTLKRKLVFVRKKS